MRSLGSLHCCSYLPRQSSTGEYARVLVQARTLRQSTQGSLNGEHERIELLVGSALLVYTRQREQAPEAAALEREDMLDMTDALRPGELFALRWRSFDNVNTLSLTETVYRRQLRPFGKTTKSLGKMHLPDGLAAELNL